MMSEKELIEARIKEKELAQARLTEQQIELERQASLLNEELRALDTQLDDIEEKELFEEAYDVNSVVAPPDLSFLSSKPIEERYRRVSRYWGDIAVHPTDLVGAYQALAEERAKFITVSIGGANTRTTAVALARLAARALEANGYEPSEVAVILASAAI